MKLSRCKLAWLLFVLFASSLFADSALGESMLLESELAGQRALHWLLQQVHALEPSENQLSTLAHLGLVLANEGAAAELVALKTLLAGRSEQASSLDELLQLLRLELRCGGEKLENLVQIIVNKGFVQDLSRESLPGLQFCLETHYLLMPQYAILSEEELLKIQKRLFKARQEFPAAALLQMLLEKQSSESEARLMQLQKACAEKSYQNAAELYWAARALSACERILPAQNGAWRRRFVATLLENQQGSGALTLNGQKRSKAESMLETALLLQVLQLALQAS
ncbi:MAG: hypothetical protein PHG44_01965 [Lentisphaeria bacterium]|nr:hypothetical protein [Lentisphaeria bacterium]MDY0177099.1 hypothetical protein [Lentisphaeria bacterium]